MFGQRQKSSVLRRWVKQSPRLVDIETSCDEDDEEMLLTGYELSSFITPLLIWGQQKSRAEGIFKLTILGGKIVLWVGKKCENNTANLGHVWNEESVVGRSNATGLLEMRSQCENNTVRVLLSYHFVRTWRHGKLVIVIMSQGCTDSVCSLVLSAYI